MGRTLHFEVKPINGHFTKKELEKLYNVGQVYADKCEWTCETFGLHPYMFYPNWNQFNGAINKVKTAWATVDKRYNELLQEELHPNTIAQKLFAEKLVLFHRDKAEFGFNGFCKTGSNELNSLQVVLGCLAATRVVKNARIHLHDEGKLLKCYIIIENGKAKADKDEIQQQIGYLLSKCMFDESYKKYYDDFVEQAKELYSFINPPNGVWYNPEELYDISKFVRPIDPKDFENHPEYGAAQIMAGFGGEYWGLAKEDPEAASYRMIAKIQKIMPKDGEMKIAQKIKTTS